MDFLLQHGVTSLIDIALGEVTILILVDFLLQRKNHYWKICRSTSHNPYFSGLSFATSIKQWRDNMAKSHNPYFSGLSFATLIPDFKLKAFEKSQSLF